MSNCTDSYKGKDKRKHLTACFCLSVIHPLVGVLAGIAKEAYDAHKEGNHWCWKDILADAVGVVLGSVVHGLILLLIL